MKKSLVFIYFLAVICFFGTSLYFIYLNIDIKKNGKEVVATPSKNVVLKQENGYLMWKYDTDGDGSWQKLFNLLDLKGADGKDGTDGKDGANGYNGRNGINGINGKDGTNGRDGTNGFNGKDGKNGVNGKDGINGIDGREVEFRANGTMIQWRYVGDSDDSWVDLYNMNIVNKNDVVVSVNGNSDNLGCYVDGTVCSAGTSMKIKVNSDEIYDFYVVSDNGGSITLIGASNIGNDDVNTVPWYAGSAGNNNYGPITLLPYLKELTSGWTNIDKISDYEYNNSGYGYKSITISEGTLSVVGNDDSVAYASDDFRARLLTYEEAIGLGCNTSAGSCPGWLYENMDGTNNSLHPYGYWLLTSYSNDNNAYNVRNTGLLTSNSTVNSDGIGIRPVIVITK